MFEPFCLVCVVGVQLADAFTVFCVKQLDGGSIGDLCIGENPFGGFEFLPSSEACLFYRGKFGKCCFSLPLRLFLNLVKLAFEKCVALMRHS